MPRPAAVFACAAVTAALAGCSEGKIEVDERNASLERGAKLFNERCSGCHTLEAADSRGSAEEGVTGDSERSDGPNFDIRRENRDDVLFAIRNGGFSGAIMPANIVVGKDAEDVALFLERYAGEKAPSTSQEPGASGEK